MVSNPYPPELVQWARGTSRRGLRYTSTSRTAKALNRSCGDSVTVCLDTDGSRISSATFEADSCAICLAATSAMCAAVEGIPLSEVEDHMTSLRTAVATGAGEGHWSPFVAIHPHPSRHTCATLVLEALGEILREITVGDTLP